MSLEYNPSESNAPQSFSWGRLILDMKLRGVPAMIACNCEPTFYDSTKPFLRLEILDTMKAMQNSPSMQRFKEALKDYFGDHLQIEIVPGAALQSPSALAGAQRITSQISALEAVMKDDMVQSMIKEWGGQILVESVEHAPSAVLAPARKPG